MGFDRRPVMTVNEVNANYLDSLSRSELIAKAHELGINRPELMTRVELRDEIIRVTETDEEKRKRARGWLGVARDLVASVVEQRLNLPDAAELIRGVNLKAPRNIPPVATVTLAEIYAAQGHTNRAVKLLDEVLLREPDHTAASTLRARLIEQQSTELKAQPPVPERDAPPPTSPSDLLPEPEPRTESESISETPSDVPVSLVETIDQELVDEDEAPISRVQASESALEHPKLVSPAPELTEEGDFDVQPSRSSEVAPVVESFQISADCGRASDPAAVALFESAVVPPGSTELPGDFPVFAPVPSSPGVFEPPEVVAVDVEPNPSDARATGQAGPHLPPEPDNTLEMVLYYRNGAAIACHWELREGTWEKWAARADGQWVIRVFRVSAQEGQVEPKETDLPIPGTSGQMLISDVEAGEYVRLAVGWQAASVFIPVVIGMEVGSESPDEAHVMWAPLPGLGDPPVEVCLERARALWLAQSDSLPA